jgi:hypothetical protein
MTIIFRAGIFALANGLVPSLCERPPSAPILTGDEMTPPKRVAAIALVIFVAAAGQTQASQIFDFSFTNNGGNWNGTVTGEIVLPFNGDGTGAASDVRVFSFPDGLFGFGSPPPHPPLDITSWVWQNGNNFQVAGGQIVQFAFSADHDFYGSSGAFSLFNSFSAFGETGGLEVATHQPVEFLQVTQSPEPGSLTLLAIGAAGIIIFAARQRCALKISPDFQS